MPKLPTPAITDASGSTEDIQCTVACLRHHKLLSMKVTQLETELSQLKARYDELLSTKEAADARYKADYIKWKNFKQWLFNENKSKRSVRRAIQRVQEKEAKEVLDTEVLVPGEFPSRYGVP